MKSVCKVWLAVKYHNGPLLQIFYYVLIRINVNEWPQFTAAQSDKAKLWIDHYNFLDLTMNNLFVNYRLYMIDLAGSERAANTKVRVSLHCHIISMM